MFSWTLIGSFQGVLQDTFALAVVALLGYLFGRRTRTPHDEEADMQFNQELSRASLIAKELQQIAGRIRNDVAAHQSNISQFKLRVVNMQTSADIQGWKELSSEAEALLIPTMKLASDLSSAYDQLRKQSQQLMNFAGSRTDPHTGLRNRQAMEDQLQLLLSLFEQNKSRFSLALFSFDISACDGSADELLRNFAELMERCARDTDVVARFSNEEFIVLMPQTSLAGGLIFSERLLQRATEAKGCVISGGIVEVQQGDDAKKILSRADSALYSARSKGYSCLYQHNGKALREYDGEAASSHSAQTDDLGQPAETEPVTAESP